MRLHYESRNRFLSVLYPLDNNTPNVNKAMCFLHLFTYLTWGHEPRHGIHCGLPSATRPSSSWNALLWCWLEVKSFRFEPVAKEVRRASVHLVLPRLLIKLIVVNCHSPSIDDNTLVIFLWQIWGGGQNLNLYFKPPPHSAVHFVHSVHALHNNLPQWTLSWTRY